jgi:tetratricopeptide (TPR) repeat protein
LNISREIGDRRGEASDRGNLAGLYLALGDYQQAISFYEQQRSMSHESGYQRGECSALGGLGIAYFFLDDYEQAISYYRRARTIAQAIGDRADEAIHCWNMGILYEELGDFATAEELMEVAAMYYREIEHMTRAQETAERLANVRQKRQQQT